jgi:hypothetical protein
VLDLLGEGRGHRAELVDELRARADELEVLHRQLLVAALRGGDGVGVLEVLEEVEAVDGEAVRPDVGDLLVDVGVEALDERDDNDHGGDADDDAEQRQRRAQLVRPDGGQRQLQCLDQFHGKLLRVAPSLVAGGGEWQSGKGGERREKYCDKMR